jgi:hypothetical protein
MSINYIARLGAAFFFGAAFLGAAEAFLGAALGAAFFFFGMGMRSIIISFSVQFTLYLYRQIRIFI